MALAAGTRLGPYEVLGLIGAGGMGEVYRGRDTRLQRSVAIKVLASDLASNANLRARFAAEAKAISALNHAHICGLFDIGHQDGTDFLVMEYLEGESLASRLALGKLPLGQVLRFGVEIADALEAAHRHGIIHRDLKPANVMLTPSGAKLLDFGLAKNEVGAAGGTLSRTATAPHALTGESTIIGTLQYMSPEQIQGLRIDARTDVFAFGALLHEMATGRPAFEATTQAGLVAKILETHSPVVSSLAPLTPTALDHVVTGCLAKAADDRWQTMHDVKMQLQWIQARGSHEPMSPSRSRAAWWLWGAAATCAGALVATTLLVPFSRPAVTPARPIRFDWTAPVDMWMESYDRGVISPDGQHFVFEATVRGSRQLVLRDMVSMTLSILPGTEMAFNPFWSPDGQSVAFFHPDEHLKQVAISGGPVRVLTDAKLNQDYKGSWRGDVILFVPGRDRRIHRVPASGGTATAVEILPQADGRRQFASPQFLPDGRHFLFTIIGDPAVYVSSLDGQSIKKILEDGASPVYGLDHVFYSRGTGIFARAFDVERLECSGAEIQVADQGQDVSVSDDGTIVYRSTNVAVSTLTWFGRDGRRSSTVGAPGPYLGLTLSPHGRHATVTRGDVQGNNSDLWDADLTTGIFSRLTTQPHDDSDPAWSPDERTLAFSTNRTGRSAAFVKDLTSGKEEPLVPFDEPLVVDEWTRDGRFIIVRTSGRAVYAVATTGDRTPRKLFDTPYIKDEVHVSPNGRWVVFNADESGRWEVYLAAFPTFTSKRQISNGGGVQPQWRADSGEVFYLAPDGTMMSVRVNAGAQLTLTPPSALFPTRIAPDPFVPQYAVAADGQRFLGLDRVRGGQGFTFLINGLNATPGAVPPHVQ